MTRAAIITAALLLCAAPAAADENAPPPDEVRFIDRHDASSDCIGIPKSPLCVVETWVACDVRSDISLCIFAGQAQSARDSYPGRGPVQYRVVDIIQTLETAVSTGDADPVYAEVRLIETNGYFADGWYLDSEMVKRAKTVKTRYLVERIGRRWFVRSRTECLLEDWSDCPSRQ